MTAAACPHCASPIRTPGRDVDYYACGSRIDHFGATVAQTERCKSIERAKRLDILARQLAAIDKQLAMTSDAKTVEILVTKRRNVVAELEELEVTQ